MTQSTTDLEGRLRGDLPRLADAIAAADPTDLAPVRSSRPPRQRIVAALVAGAVALAGAAGLVIVARHHDGPTRTVVPPASPLRHSTPLAPSPLSPREGSTSVWTGSEWLVFGGRQGLLALDDSASYDPASDTWRRLAANPTMHPGAQAVWAANVAVVLAKAGGWIYDPTLDRWTQLPPQARGTARTVEGGTGVWTGREVVVVGYSGGMPTSLVGRTLDPSTATWGTPSVAVGSSSPSIAGIAGATWDGSRVQAWLMDGTGWAYDPGNGRWTSLPKLAVPGRTSETATAIASTGERTYALTTTGDNQGSTTQLAVFENGAWRLVGDPRHGPAGDGATQLVATANELVEFSAQQAPQVIDPDRGATHPLPGSLTPPGTDRSIVWTGSELLVWGGRDMTPGTQTSPGTPGTLSASGVRIS